jgi:hypothetical protein
VWFLPQRCGDANRRGFAPDRHAAPRGKQLKEARRSTVAAPSNHHPRIRRRTNDAIIDCSLSNDSGTRPETYPTRHRSATNHTLCGRTWVIRRGHHKCPHFEPTHCGLCWGIKRKHMNVQPSGRVCRRPGRPRSFAQPALIPGSTVGFPPAALISVQRLTHRPKRPVKVELAGFGFLHHATEIPAWCRTEMTGVLG